MSYNDREGDQQQQQSCELYTLTTGSTVARFTSYYTDVTLDGNTYTHIPVKRSGFTVDLTGSVPTITLDVPIIAPFSNYIVESPVEPTTIQIHKYFLYGATWPHVLMFTGMIQSVLIQKNIARATCVSKQFELKRRIPRVVIQSYCNNNLFDDVCQIAKASWKITATITGASGDNLTANEFDDVAPNDKGNLTHGYVEFGSDKRFIVDHDTGTKTITLQERFSGIQVGDSVTVYAGCDKSPATCLNKFNNLDQFVGFPYTPSASPVLFGRAVLSE